MTPSTNPPEPMPTENKTAEQFARDAAGRIAKEHYLGLTCFCAFNEFGGLVQECSSCSGIKSLVWEIEKAITQSTAAQSSEIAAIDSALAKYSRCHPDVVSGSEQIVVLGEMLKSAEERLAPYREMVIKKNEKIQQLEDQLSQQSLEIERLKGDLTTAVRMLGETQSQLTALQDVYRDLAVEHNRILGALNFICGCEDLKAARQAALQASICTKKPLTSSPQNGEKGEK